MSANISNCCHQLDIGNDCYPQVFTRLQMEIITDGVQFANIENGDPENWNFTFPNGTSTIIDWNPNGGFISNEIYENLISFCLSGDESETQEVLVSWYHNDPDSPSGEEIVLCTDILTYECTVLNVNCASVWYDSISCDETSGIYDLTLSLIHI